MPDRPDRFPDIRTCVKPLKQPWHDMLSFARENEDLLERTVWMVWDLMVHFCSMAF